MWARTASECNWQGRARRKGTGARSRFEPIKTRVIRATYFSLTEYPIWKCRLNLTTLPMTKLHAQQDAVNLHLLNHNDSTLDLDNGDWLAQDISRSSRTPSLESALSWLTSKRILLKILCGVTIFAIVVTSLVLSRQHIIARVRNWHTS